MGIKLDKPDSFSTYNKFKHMKSDSEKPILI